jgi:non-heme chloroperoxidase
VVVIQLSPLTMTSTKCSCPTACLVLSLPTLVGSLSRVTRLSHFAAAACVALQLLSATPAHSADSVWTDRSPHKTVIVHNGDIALECLDWGGKGDAVVLLAGMGTTAHIYDDFAPKLTDTFRVIALTRRGLGQSAQPAGTYDLPALVEDIRHCLDTLAIDRAVLIGHSFGAVEVAAFAVAHPDRVRKVVYLDGAYTPSPERRELMQQASRLMPSPSREEAVNFAGLLAWLKANRPGWNDACEADLRNQRFVDPTGSTPRPPPAAMAALMQTAKNSPPEFDKVKVPTLALFSDNQVGKLMSKLDASTASDREVLEKLAAFQRNAAARFREQVKNAAIVEMPDTDHFCFIQRETEVARLVREFLLAP